MTITLKNAALFPVHQQTIDLPNLPDVIVYGGLTYVRIGIQEQQAFYREATVHTISSPQMVVGDAGVD